jgi:hypothetical protein
MKLHLKLATALTLVLTSLITPVKPSFAQVPIREIQQTQGLTISGVVTAVFGNKFVIDDGTGQILVETGPPWYHQIRINQGEAVTVIGKYDDNDFDAFTKRSRFKAPSFTTDYFCATIVYRGSMPIIYACV